MPLKCKPPTDNSKRMRVFNNLRDKMHAIFFFKLCQRRLILGIQSPTRSLHTQQWVFCNGTDRQTDMATLWPNRPRGPIQWKCVKVMFLCLTRNNTSKSLSLALTLKKNIIVFKGIFFGQFYPCMLFITDQCLKTHQDILIILVKYCIFFQKIPHTGDTNSLDRCG